MAPSLAVRWWSSRMARSSTFPTAGGLRPWHRWCSKASSPNCDVAGFPFLQDTSCAAPKGTAIALRVLMTPPSRSGESFRFADRRSAGIALARRLQQFANRPDVVVLALPRGGVPVAYEVARSLGAPMDVFVVRKLGLPGHPELAMGAIASGGVQVLNEDVATWYRPSTAAVEAVARAERLELERRERAYRDGRPPVPIEARIVLLVDDGLATGSTMRAAVLAIRRLRPARVVVAVPVGARETCESLGDIADEVVCALIPEPFSAVGLWYVDFSQTSDDEVRQLLAAHSGDVASKRSA